MKVFGDASNLTIVGFILTIVSFVFELISFATPYWQYSSVGVITANSGLWQECSTITGCLSITCESSDDGCSVQFKVSQTMEAFAFIALLASVVLVVLFLFVMKSKDAIKKAGAVSCAVGGVLALIGAILYATVEDTKAENLHFSFSFCIIASVGAVASSVLLMIK